MFKFKRRPLPSQTEESISIKKNKKKNVIYNQFISLFHQHNNSKDLRSKIKSSYVIPESGRNAAYDFSTNEKFNRVNRNLTQSEKETLRKDKEEIMSGIVTPLIGKGIISSTCKNKESPIKYDHVIIDKEHDSVSRETSVHKHGIYSYNGLSIESAEIIPGTPIGNYHNKQMYPEGLNVIEVNNGNCGVIGIRLHLGQLKSNNPLLIHGGALSGCTIAFAIKDDCFYAFHCGQSGNNKSLWETGREGVDSIINAHHKLIGTHSKEKVKPSLQVLVEHFQDNFDSAMIIFCGHDDDVTNQKGNVIAFDYNKPIPSIDHRKARVANAAAVLIKVNGEFKINAVGDDIIIDKESLETESKSNFILSLL